MGDVVLDEIQGLVRTGFKRLTSARYLLFSVGDQAAARRWLGGLPLTSAGHRPAEERPTRAVQIAFTYAGLEILGLDQRALGDLSEELREGMVTDHRQRILGDHGDSDPESWTWGGPKNDPIHGALLLYAADGDQLEALASEVRAGAGVTWLDPALDTSWLPGDKEQFGFHDGVAQPNVLGVQAEQPGFDVVAPGEVLLGYPNQYGKLPRAPRIAGHSALLPGGNDFGRGGSYLVMRQLAQDVAGLWTWARETAERLHVADLFPAAEDPGVLVAAKMVGRWPNGAPLVRWPDAEPDTNDPDVVTDNSFRYFADDPHGLACPLGSHIRRANPRDWFLADDPTEALAVADHHRILRRGRAYGPPLVADMNTAELSRAPDDGASRGLMFLCLNANIGRQFEFVQHTWMNGPKFGGLHAGADPLVGDQKPETSARDLPPSFIIQAEPARLRCTDIRRFVTTCGGAYFFLPSIPAVRYLASL